MDIQLVNEANLSKPTNTSLFRKYLRKGLSKVSQSIMLEVLTFIIDCIYVRPNVQDVSPSSYVNLTERTASRAVNIGQFIIVVSSHHNPAAFQGISDNGVIQRLVSLPQNKYV
jgi:hypothetical protein